MAEMGNAVASPPLDLMHILKRERWQEAIFLTYSFDLPFFEAYILPTLVGNGCQSVAVAACATWLPERLEGWSEAGEIREAGRSYTLSTVSVGGVFHPKLVLAVGESRGLILVGSGNISEYGMASGGELFTLVEWDGDRAPSLAREGWQLCREVARRLTVDRSFAARVEALGRLAPTLASPPDERLLVHNLSQPILDQFLEYLPGGEIEELIVWSPFTDRQLDALDVLVERVRPRRVIVGVQAGLTRLEGARLAALEAKWTRTAWHVRAMHQPGADPPRLIHAKGILATAGSGELVALIGSPNLSASALLQGTTSGNFELAVLHRAPDLRDRLFGQGGVVTFGDTVEFSRLMWEDDPTTAGRVSPPPTLQLLGAHLEGQWLGIEIRGTPPTGAKIELDGAVTLEMTFARGEWGAAVDGALSPRTAELVWDGGHSGPVIVHDLARLTAMRRGTEPRKHTPLEALDYGSDSDIIALLDQLAHLAIGSVYDVDRMLRGGGPPTPEEEQNEALDQAPVVHLDDIDFGRVHQHPRAHAYGRSGGEDFDAPRIQLWLDEVVHQFQSLRDRQLLRVVQPIATDGAGEEEDRPAEIQERHRWPVSRRVAVRVRNRLRRYVAGMADPRFWRLVAPEWMATNYVLFLSLLDLLWTRAATAEAILSGDDLGPLTLDLLAGYWGDDRRGGYLSHLGEDELSSSAGWLKTHHGDALTATACIRLLESKGSAGRRAPFAVGTYVRAGQELGLVTEEALERALERLERTDELPGPYIQRLVGTVNHFTWDRFAANLAWRHGLKSAVPLADVPGVGRFHSGEVLVVDCGEDLPVSQAALQVFGEWVQEVHKREPHRNVIQMVWGKATILIYDAMDQEVLMRPCQPEGGDLRAVLHVIASSVSPDEIPTVMFNDAFPAAG